MCQIVLNWHKNTFAFSIIAWFWGGTGSWYPCLWKTRSRGPCTVNTMAADDLVRQRTRSSASLVLTQLWVTRSSASLVLTQLWVTRSSASLVLTQLCTNQVISVPGIDPVMSYQVISIPGIDPVMSYVHKAPVYTVQCTLPACQLPR